MPTNSVGAPSGTSTPLFAKSVSKVGQVRELFRNAAWNHARHKFEATKISQSRMRRMYAGTYKLALELIVVQEEIHQIDEVAELLGQFSCKNVKMSADIQRMYAGTYNSPWNSLSPRPSWVKLTRLPSCLGSSPAQKVKCQPNAQTHMYAGTYNRTCEVIELQPEHL